MIGPRCGVGGWRIACRVYHTAVGMFVQGWEGVFYVCMAGIDLGHGSGGGGFESLVSLW